MVKRSDSMDEELQQAVYIQDAEKVRSVLATGVAVNMKDIRGATALHRAAHYGNVEVVSVLVERGADILARNSHGDTAIHIAAYHNNQAVVALLIEGGVGINVEGKNGQPALHVAAHCSHHDLMELLLEQGATIDMKGHDGGTALHLAAYHGDAVMVSLLLERGAEVNAKNNDGDTALHLAARQSNTVVANLLLGNGAKLEENKEHQNAIEAAAAAGRIQMIHLLHSHFRSEIPAGIGHALRHCEAHLESGNLVEVNYPMMLLTMAESESDAQELTHGLVRRLLAARATAALETFIKELLDVANESLRIREQDNIPNFDIDVALDDLRLLADLISKAPGAAELLLADLFAIETHCDVHTASFSQNPLLVFDHQPKRQEVDQSEGAVGARCVKPYKDNHTIWHI